MKGWCADVLTVIGDEGDEINKRRVYCRLKLYGWSQGLAEWSLPKSGNKLIGGKDGKDENAI